MIEKIYTIPVNDAFAAGGFCPLCSLRQRLDGELIDYYLGPSLMEPDVRQTTNNKGFCQDHLIRMQICDKNRLGLGLMLDTHIAAVRRETQELLAAAAQPEKRGLFARRGADDAKIAQAADRIDQRAQACVICERVNQTMERYLEVIFYEYRQQAEFRARLFAAEGFCLPHVSQLLRGANRYLDASGAASFAGQLAHKLEQQLAALNEDVNWFTLKYDYRNQDKDWKNSRDALPRAIETLKGRRVE